MQVEAGESKLLLFELFTTDTSYRGACAPKNWRGDVLLGVEFLLGKKGGWQKIILLDNFSLVLLCQTKKYQK